MALDSNFGMAYRLIGVAFWNAQVNRQRMIDAVSHAYRLRDRMPEHEAAHAEAFYYGAVENNPAKSAEAYERLLARWPDDLVALNNLSVYYDGIGRDSMALELTRKTLAVQPNLPIYWGNYVESLVKLNLLDEADSATREWERHVPGNTFRLRQAAIVARERGQTDRALLLADSITASPGGLTRVRGLTLRADILRTAGRYHDAETAARSAVNRSGEAALPSMLLGNAFDLFWTQAFVFDHPDAAVALLDQALARYPLDSMPPANRPYGAVIAAYAYAGRLPRAEALEAAYERAVPAEIRSSDGDFWVGLGYLSLARGKYREAIEQFRHVEAVPRACRRCTAFEQGMAYDKLSMPDSAVAEFERLVNTRTVDDEGRSITMAAALKRLGELYESRGDRAKALEYYGRFVDLWKDADPELRPAVADVRKHMADLARQRG